MAENLLIPNDGTKEQKYDALLPQIKFLVAGEPNRIANLANIAAALHTSMGWWWTGFYLVEGTELVLGPFQGPVACTRIAFGRGVCGTAWKDERSILVPDVNAFPGHIACSSLSVSEIVVPLFSPEGKVIGVLDVDSERYDALDETDVKYLELVAQIITELP